MHAPFLVIAPAWMPHAVAKAYGLTLAAFGLFLNKLGLKAPVYLDWAFGANAGHLSSAQVIDDTYTIVEAAASWTTAGTDGGAVTLTVEKLTGTQAPTQGANMFKTSTISLKGTANTVNRLISSQLTALTAAQKAAQIVKRGDRISATLGGTLTSLDGLAVMVILKRLPSSNYAR